MTEQNLVSEMDCSTGVVTVRSMTQDEIDARVAAQVQAQADSEARAAADAADAATKASIGAKLSATPVQSLTLAEVQWQAKAIS